MKKQIFTVAAIAAAVLVTSCTNYKAKEVTLANETDSVSYAFGVSNGKYLKDEISRDSTLSLKKIIDALNEGYGSSVASLSQEEINAYFQGKQLGGNVKAQPYFTPDSSIAVLPATIHKAIKAVLFDEKLEIVAAEAQGVVDSIFGLANDTVKHSFDKTTAEKLNYAIGVNIATQSKNYFFHNDSTKKLVKAYMKGLEKALKGAAKSNQLLEQLEGFGVTLKTMSKGAGIFNDSTVLINKNLVFQGIINAIEGEEHIFTTIDPQQYIQGVHLANEAKKHLPNKAAGDKFLAENKLRSEVKTTESGLQYEIITEGKGKIPTDTSTVSVLYKGTLIDGTEFDSSLDPKNPTTFSVTGVIKGWTEALKLMSAGSKWKIYVPQELAYGTADMGTIKPYSALIFEIELLEVK